MGHNSDDGYWREFGVAVSVTIVTGLIAGAVNGWIAAEHIDTILDNMERRASGVGRRRSGWFRNAPYILPLLMGGLGMFGFLWKFGIQDDLRFLLALSAGALAGYGAAWLVGTNLNPEQASAIAIFLLVPAGLFVIMPILKYIND